MSARCQPVKVGLAAEVESLIRDHAKIAEPVSEAPVYEYYLTYTYRGYRCNSRTMSEDEARAKYAEYTSPDVRKEGNGKPIVRDVKVYRRPKADPWTETTL